MYFLYKSKSPNQRLLYTIVVNSTADIIYLGNSAVAQVTLLVLRFQ